MTSQAGSSFFFFYCGVCGGAAIFFILPIGYLLVILYAFPLSVFLRRNCAADYLVVNMPARASFFSLPAMRRCCRLRGKEGMCAAAKKMYGGGRHE